LIDQQALRRMVLQQYTWMDPSAVLLLAQQGGQMPGMEGMEGLEGLPPGMDGMMGGMPQQPPSSSSPGQPIDFEQFARSLRGQQG
jgi:hypothetical protein